MIQSSALSIHRRPRRHSLENKKQVLSYWPFRRPTPAGYPQTAKIWWGLGRASDPCVAELLLQAVPKVARKKFPGIVY